MHYYPLHQMEMSGQLHAPVAHVSSKLLLYVYRRNLVLVYTKSYQSNLIFF